MTYSARTNVRSQLLASMVVGLVWWLSSALRHLWLQSNGFDLGIYDQVAWQISRGLEPRSSMLGLHHMGNHGAWAFYLIGAAYYLWPSIQWLLASQAFSLALTALPLAALWRQALLPERLSWLPCLLWWLQPQVFNTNLFDFHPEVWAMPAMASCIWCSRAQKPLPWVLCLLWLLGCRDGLALVVIGLGLAELAQRRWRWGFSAIGLGLGWILMLSEWLYPLLNGPDQGPAALSRFSSLGDSIPSILLSSLQRPWVLVDVVPWLELPIYGLLLTLPTALFWRRRSLTVLLAALPLVLVNLISSNAAQRNLVHHYNLPIAVIAVVAAIDGLKTSGCRMWPWRRLAWAAVCWAALAKPWFFGGNYLSRLDQIADVNEALRLIPAESRVITTSHLAPQLTHRRQVEAIGQKPLNLKRLDRFDVMLVNPSDPGWQSRTSVQIKALELAKEAKWYCQSWTSELELCKKLKEATDSSNDNDAPK
ncbi:DUF2079 domain-containing protein [Synechococcus sp. CC9311]|uniref:DUF2079 domain-containing protein n=1 Tax=Synechococcus sp. (strain CC9311) TaxID=64471 RepID=UPI0000DDB2ED|nr:DUF2079 domain-containing protein [Synechococcus sp. CC9311]ABI45706.1 putative membrane protein [Synechococcus sp. CC9311]